MHTKKIILVSLIANALSACSSPPKLSEPEGDWISFEPTVKQQPLVTHSSKSVLQPVVPLTLQQQPVSFAAPALPDASKSILVRTDGNKVPLFKAVRDVTPTSWSVKLSPDVAQNFRGSVSWSGNDQWPFVLNKMLSQASLKADINDAKKEVVVSFAKPAAVPIKTVAPLTVKSAVPLATKPVSKLPDIVEANKTKVLQPPLVPVVTQAPEHSIPAKPKPAPIIKPVPVMKVWKLDKGTSLKQGFDLWVSREACPTGKGKWNVRWDTDTDYAIDYPLSFTSSSFEDATSQLFDLYRKAQAPLYVSGYRNQCLIVISDRK